MIPESLLAQDLKNILSPIIGGDVFIYKDLEFKGHLRKDSEVLFEDSTIGYKTTLLITLKTFNDLGLKIKEEITGKQTNKSYKILQAITESKVLKRIILEEIK